MITYHGHVTIVWVFANSGRGLRVSLDPSEPPSVCTRSSLPFYFLNSPHFYFPKIPSLKLSSDHKAKAEEDDKLVSDPKLISTTHLTTYQHTIYNSFSPNSPTFSPPPKRQSIRVPTVLGLG